MKRNLFILFAGICLCACHHATCGIGLENADIVEYVEMPEEYADSITGYATFSVGNRFMILSEEITKEQYEQLLTDDYVIKPKTVDPKSTLYNELSDKSQENIKRYGSMRGYIEEDYGFVEERECDFSLGQIYYYPETKQYNFNLNAPLTTESFMIMEGNVTDSTFMQSETKTYGKNRIFVGQKGHDCDFHGSLWFYWYDESNQHMTPLCHYLDYRWSEDTYDFNLCWISADEILVSAISTGNNFVHGWAGGYKPADLAPWGTQVYYKLRLTYK